jgi:hypothetical protein
MKLLLMDFSFLHENRASTTHPDGGVAHTRKKKESRKKSAKKQRSSCESLTATPKKDTHGLLTKKKLLGRLLIKGNA